MYRALVIGYEPANRLAVLAGPLGRYGKFKNSGVRMLLHRKAESILHRKLGVQRLAELAPQAIALETILRNASVD